MKHIIISVIFATFSFLLQAQSKAVQQVLFATTEKEMYKIYEQLLDSTLLLKEASIGNHFQEIESNDTLVKFEQYCYWHVNGDYICERNSYFSYISNSQPISFYENFLDYLVKLGQNDNYFYKRFSTSPLSAIGNILIRKYEAKKLSQKESKEVLELIEKITLRRINNAHDYWFLYGDNKYMTENIRQALINVIEHPFYPESYLDFYLNEVVDTTVLDTTGIPLEIQKKYKKWKGLYVSGNSDYDSRLASFHFYKRMGDELGLSPGQAYMEEKKKAFQEKGYLDINAIADYAYKTQDTLLIKHLKEFKKEHPDYPLRHF
ncbi:MAG: hypothetical protein GX966_09735 [Jeotgalicoccus halophilus]|nr:hypothetical protein [Jeotgalicoccus aerolatus]